MMSRLSEELDLRELTDVIHEVTDILTGQMSPEQRHAMRDMLNRLRDIQASAVLQRLKIEGL